MKPSAQAPGVDNENPAGRATLPRTSRLLKPADFKRVFKNNRVSSDRCFRILVLGNQADRCRLGMAVSRKIDRKAVGRNRIKRVVRESFRRWCARRAELENGFVDVVVLPRHGTNTICNEQLTHSLDRHWSRVETLVKEESGRSRAV